MNPEEWIKESELIVKDLKDQLELIQEKINLKQEEKDNILRKLNGAKLLINVYIERAEERIKNKKGDS